MATISYSYAVTTAEFTVGSFPLAVDQTNADIAVYDSGVFSIVYSTETPATGLDFAIQNFNSDGTPGPMIASVPDGNQSAMTITTLSNGGQMIAGVNQTAPNGAGGSSIVWGGSGLPNALAPNIAGNQADDQSSPDVAGLTGDRKVIVWADEFNGSTTDIDIRMSLYNNAGDQTIKDAVLVTGAPGVQRPPSVSALKIGGGFVATWSDDGGDASKTRIMAQRYDSEGDKVGAAIVIDNVGDNDASKVIGLWDGGFAVVYEDTQFGPTKDISLRIFNADGTARIDAMRVNETTANTDSDPVITELANGFITVSWTHNVAAGNNDLYMRTFAADGVAVTGEFRYQGTDATTFDERESAIAATKDGRLVAAWTDGELTDEAGTHIGAAVYAVRRTSIGGAAVDDTVTGDALQDLMNGLGGEDKLDGFGGDDHLVGGAGNDLLRGGAGNDILDGGGDVDTADYGHKFEAVVVTLAGAADAIVKAGGVNEDTIRNIENVHGGSGADILTGDGFANLLRGNGGKDILDGGAGVDTADYGGMGFSVEVFLNGSTDATVVINAIAQDTIRNIENIFGGFASDTLVGDGLANLLKGNNSKDYLHSNGYGADGLMKIGAGSDTLEGGAGDDGLFGGDGADTLDGGSENDGLVGGGGADTLYGGAGTDFLFGGAFGAGGEQLANSGVDVLNGGADKDGLYGFDGADTLNGDAGDDYVEGGAGADIINGGAGADFLLGQDGVDTISGGAGFDYMYGGAQADLFVFHKGDSADWILDFKAADGDKLKFNGFSFASFAAIPLVDLSTPGSPAVGMTLFNESTSEYDQLAVFGVGLAQLNVGNVLFA